MKVWSGMRGFRAAWVAGLLLSLSACSNAGKFFPPPCTTNCTPTNSGNYLYVANTSVSVSSVAGITINTSSLGGTSSSPYAMAAPPSTLAITPSDKFLYAGSLAGGIFVYTINSNGSLSLGNSGSAAVVGVSPLAMQVDPTGQWLVVVDATFQMHVFSVNSSTGQLTTQGNPIPTSTGSPSHLVFTPNGTRVFVALGSGGVDVFNFVTNTGSINGPITHINPISSSNGDLAVASDPNSAYLFVAETGKLSSTVGNGLRIFPIPASGNFSEISSSPVQTGLGPSQILVTANGSYVYVTNRTDGTISGFALAATGGTLTPLTGSPYGTGSTPVDIVEDKTHAYVGVANAGGSPDMQVFTIGAATATVPGALTSFGTSGTGADPTAPNAIVATK